MNLNSSATRLAKHDFYFGAYGLRCALNPRESPTAMCSWRVVNSEWDAAGKDSFGSFEDVQNAKSLEEHNGGA